MPQCLSFSSTTSSSPSPSCPNPTSPLPDHTPSVSQIFTRTVLGNSYKELRSIIESQVFDPPLADEHTTADSQRKFLEQLLQPDRDSVHKCLSHLTSNSLNHLLASYFVHSEAAFHLCLRLLLSLRYARLMYAPLGDLLDALLPFDSNHFNQSHCDNAFDVFSLFDTQDNPFSSHDSINFDHLRASFSELDQQLHRALQQSHSKLRRLRCAAVGSSLCLVTTAVGVIVATVVITTHALIAVVFAGGAICPAICSFRNPRKKELVRIAQVEAASRVTFALKQHLDSIDRLVVQLKGAVKADKHSVRIVLEMGKNRFAIQEIVKLLRKRNESFRLLMDELEMNVYISLNFVNRARTNLLRQICPHQNESTS